MKGKRYRRKIDGHLFTVARPDNESDTPPGWFLENEKTREEVRVTNTE